MKSPHPGSVGTTPDSIGTGGQAGPQDTDETTCPRCGESHDLAKVKGCIKCLKCGFKFDCNGW